MKITSCRATVSSLNVVCIYATEAIWEGTCDERARRPAPDDLAMLSRKKQRQVAVSSSCDYYIRDNLILLLDNAVTTPVLPLFSVLFRPSVIPGASCIVRRLCHCTF